MRKPTAVIAAGVALGLVLTGCASGSNEGGGVPQAEEAPSKLTMLVTSSPSATGLAALAETYKSETGIAVEFVEVPTSQLPTKIILAAQAGQATFDLAMVDGFTMPQVVAAGALLPLDDFLANDKEYDYPNDFPKGLQEYAKYEGVSYGVPLSTEPYLQWYRADIYEELGLEPATTWEQAIENAEAVQATGAYGYMPVYGPASSTHFFNEMLISSGGRLLDPETYEPLLNTDLAKQIMEQYISLNEFAPSSALTATSADAVTAFTQLDVAQMILASGWWSNINDPESSKVAGKVATAVTPFAEEGPYEPASALYGWLAGVSAASPYQQAAWDFLSWALSPEQVGAFIDAGAPPPGRISTTTNPEYLEALPYLATVGESAETGLAMPRIPEMSQIVTIVSQNTNAIASGQLTVDEGLEKMQNEVLNLLVLNGRYKG